MPTALRVLIVEDSPTNVELMLAELRRSGFEPDWQRVETTEGFASSLVSEVELVLSAYSLPQFDASEVLPLLRERGLDIPFIIVTGSVGEEPAVECMKRGASDYLLTDRLARLGPAVAQALEAKRLRDEQRVTAQETQRRNRELTLLNEIVVAASASKLEPESVLSKACQELALAFGVSHAAAFLFDEERRTATFAAEHAPPDQTGLTGSTLPVAQNPIFEHILAHRTPVVASEGIDGLQLNPIRNRLIHCSTPSVLVLPLTIESKVLGGVELRTSEPYDYTVQQVGLAWRVAAQLSSAIARSRLNKDRRLLSAAIQQTAESVIITDTDGTIVYVNPGFEQTTGYRRSEAIGKTPKILRSGEHDEAYYRDVWATLEAGKRWRGRFVNRRKDGTLYTVDSSITPVRDESGRVVSYVDVQRDVTHELQLEERYLQAQKMEAVGRLAGGIAHDFNNLLTAIKGYTGILLSAVDAVRSGGSTQPASQQTGLDPDTLSADLQEIDRATDQAASLVRRLMAFSRKQVLQPQLLDLNRVVTSAQGMLSRLIGEDIELVTKCNQNLVMTRADPSQMEQVIMNLAVNARDAMPGGGRLVLETYNRRLEGPPVEEHPGLESGTYAVLEVSDTGTGMEKEVLAHIFEPFYTTKEVGKGTGLGLATVHGIITQSGGAVEVSTEVGIGTTFRVYLPRATEAAVSQQETRDADVLPTGQETILVVEDEGFVRELTSRILRKQGYTVLAAGHPNEALRCCSEHDGAIDLLLTDVIMPGMGGPQLARTLSATYSGLKTLYVSGYTDDAIAQHGVLDDGVAFLQKPFTARALATKVRQVLNTP